MEVSTWNSIQSQSRAARHQPLFERSSLLEHPEWSISSTKPPFCHWSVHPTDQTPRPRDPFSLPIGPVLELAPFSFNFASAPPIFRCAAL